MKKSLLFLMIFVFLGVLASCEQGPTLRLYNWGEYIDDSLVEAFEEESGIRVRQIAFDSNEVAITQMKGGNQYDLVIPSDYAIEQLAKEKLIQEIDWSRVETFNKNTDLATGLQTILDRVKEDANDPFDLLKYSIPYFWGNVGILYNKETVDASDLDGWDTLHLSNTYRIAYYNSARDSFMPALKAIGAETINHPNANEMSQAVTWLSNGLTSEVSVITDEIFDAMLDPTRYDLVVSYSGDANYLMSENDKLDFYVPEEGTNVWVDGFVVPVGANDELSYEFINFLLEYDNAKQNTEFVAYSTPRKDVFEEMIGVGGSFEAYKASYDVRINNFDEVYRYNEELKVEMDTKWQEILANKGFDTDEGLGTGTIVLIVGVGLLIVSSVVLSFIKKKKNKI